MDAPELAEISETIRSTGLEPRGAFHPESTDQVPEIAGAPTRTMVLVGNVGPAMWDAFLHAPEHALIDAPLDTWTQRVVDTLASALGAAPLYPFGGPPYHPFQRWARRAEPVYPSPLGLLIHPDHGLWHAYRAALIFTRHIDLPPRAERANPCESCATKPCLTQCPVAAFTPGHYDVAGCVRHVLDPSGMACRIDGCLARRACPVGQKSLYPSAQRAFHMSAFLARHGGAAGRSWAAQGRSGAARGPVPDNA